MLSQPQQKILFFYLKYNTYSNYTHMFNRSNYELKKQL